VRCLRRQNLRRDTSWSRPSVGLVDEKMTSAIRSVPLRGKDRGFQAQLFGDSCGPASNGGPEMSIQNGYVPFTLTILHWEV